MTWSVSCSPLGVSYLNAYGGKAAIGRGCYTRQGVVAGDIICKGASLRFYRRRHNSNGAHTEQHFWSSDTSSFHIKISGAPLFAAQKTRERQQQVPRLQYVRAGMLEELANTNIPRQGGPPILAYVAWPEEAQKHGHASSAGDGLSSLPVLLLIHEFWGLAPELCGKAAALAKELKCVVIAPDTYRGASTRFIPKAIYLALTTPQERVNEDLDAVVAWASQQPGFDSSKLAVMGFCYGGGKAIRFSSHFGEACATVVVYGKPETDVNQLLKIRGGPLLGIFGDKDNQFSTSLIQEFESALKKAGVDSQVSIYAGEGHAFWRDMEQVEKDADGPQRRAWLEITSFLKTAFWPT